MSFAITANNNGFFNNTAATEDTTTVDETPSPTTNNADAFVMTGALATAGGLSLADGPLPFGEIAGLTILTGAAISQIPTGGGKNVGDRLQELAGNIFAAKRKDDWTPRKPPRKGSESRRPGKGTERNVGGHHGAGNDNSEHSRVNKGPKGPRRR